MLDQAREYLARVIPWPQAGEPGFVNVHWTFPPKEPRPDGKPLWTGRACKTMQEAVSALNMALKAGSNTLDIYACMSMQAVAEPKVSAKGFKYNAARKFAENAISLKAFFLDIDIKAGPKGYSSWDELVTALAEFIHATKLPKPTMMVHSGGGVHVYWLIDKPISPHEWVPIAARLVEATRRHNLRCDTQVSIDPARVLRIPDTFNRKEATPRNVRFIGTPVDYDYSLDRIRDPLSAYTPAAGHSLASGLIDRSIFPVRPPDNSADELQNGLSDLRPLPKLGDVLSACGFLATAVATGGRDFDQPLWNLTTLISTFTEGGRADAHLMAAGHATYTKESTDELFDRKDRERTERGLGWPSCSAISGAGAKACASCAFRSHGKSPLNFEQRPAPSAAGPSAAGSAQGGGAAGQTAGGSPTPQATAFGPAVAATTQPVGPVAAGAATHAPSSTDLPAGYQRDASGYIAKILPDPNNPGGNVLVRISDYPMMDAWLQNDPKVLHFESIVERNKTAQIDLPFEVTGTADMRKHLQSQGLMIPMKDQYLGEFFVAWINKLQQIKDMVSSSPFGWLNRNGQLDGFVFGDKLWTAAGSEPAATANAVLAQRYRPKGSDVFWMDAAKLVCGVGRPDLEALVASAFAAPLVVFTGHKGALLSAFSRESGIGKTTAVTIAQSVWGNPVKGIQGLTDTENAVMGIVGEIKSLPLYWDELKSEKDTKKFVNMTFQISSGKGKSRMDSRANLREPGDWQTLIISASNESLIDHVVAQTNTTAAGIMRIFEYRVAPPTGQGRVATSDATIRLSKLNNNYGHVGLKYAQFLGANHAQIAVDMAALAKQIEQETNADQEERFWVSVIACVLLGARYAGAVGYPVFDEPALKAFLYKALTEMRTHRKNQTVDLDQSLNVSAILNRFFNDVKKNNTWMVTNRIHVGRGKPVKPGNPGCVTVIQPADGRLAGVEVQVGIDNHLMRISNSAFSAWCRKNEINKVNLLDALMKSTSATIINGGRMGAGTSHAGLNEHIIEIDLNSSKDLDFVSDLI